MKPTVPETGQVIRVDKDIAVVVLQAGKSCKGCGAAELGLCKPSGDISTLTVRNSAGAVVGNTVKVGFTGNVQARGFLFAFIIPFLSFIAGSIFGYIAGKKLGIPSFEVAAGFISLVVASLFSFRRLKRLDGSQKMAITGVVSDYGFGAEIKTDEEKRFEDYAGSGLSGQGLR